MHYVTDDVVSLIYNIPTKRLEDLTEAANFHLEVQFLKEKFKKNFTSAELLPATSETVGDVTVQIPARIVFSDIPVEQLGAHTLTVFYADGSDLDADGVAVEKLVSVTISKIVPTTELIV